MSSYSSAMPTLTFHVPQHLVPVIYRDKAQDLVKELNEVVQSTVGGKRKNMPSSESSSHVTGLASRLLSLPIHVDASTNYTGVFFKSHNTVSTQTTVTEDKEGEKKTKKSEEPSPVVLAVAALAFTVLGGFYSYFIGRALAEKADAEADLDKVDELNNIVVACQRQLISIPASDYQALHLQINAVNDVVDSAKTVFVTKRSEAIKDIALNMAVVAAAIIGGVGVLLASKTVLVVGGLGCLVVGCVKLIKSGTNAMQSRQIQSAAKIVSKKAEALFEVFRQVKNPQGEHPIILLPQGLYPSVPSDPLTASAPGYYD